MPSERLAHYQLLGQLATGGMAQIFLARVVGPGGFERPVVVKRILPHLAREASFVRMFLDEARVVAQIRHRNVVHVHELVHEGDELFLVMEYLEGESLAGVVKRLFRQAAELPVALAAYVIAEACAGLHAAHELSDADGVNQNLVHRDVSPQNLFVTYDGQVKVIDFGIAKTIERPSHTETGQLKGKLGYMSPEQCRGAPLDRRSDVFALGVVLYELATGRRLFHGPDPLQIIRSICEDPLVPPSRLRVAGEAAAALDAICMRALARAPEDRYATAAEMRQELLAVSGAGQRVPPAEILAEHMGSLFAERIAEKRELLTSLRAGAHVEVPPGEADDSVELPGVARPPPTSPHRGRRVAWVAGMAAVIAVGVWVQKSRALAPLAQAPADPPAPVTHSVEPGLEAPAPPDSSEVAFRVETAPAGAAVTIDGVARGTTPVSLMLPQKGEAVTLRLERKGYEVMAQRVVPDRTQTLVVALKPLPAKGTRPAPHRNAAKVVDSPWAKWH